MQAGAALTAPGGPFEITIEPVLDQPSMEVFANRTRSVGDLLRQSGRHGDKDYLVFSDGRRITFTEVRHMLGRSRRSSATSTAWRRVTGSPCAPPTGLAGSCRSGRAPSSAS